MKISILVAVAALCALGWMAVGQPPDGSHEGQVKEMLGTIDDITKILKTIQDPDSAMAARPDLKKTGDKLVGLQKQAAEGKQPTKTEKDRLEKEYAPKMEIAVKKFHDETIRVKGIKGGLEALGELPILKDKADGAKSKKRP